MTKSLWNKRIPKHVVETLKGHAEYCFSAPEGKQITAGYTIRIWPRNKSQSALELSKEVGEVLAWARRNCKYVTCEVLHRPARRRSERYAIVTIFDPVMHKIEHLVEETGGVWPTFCA